MYEHPAVRWLLGGELHPGGQATTRRALELAGAAPGQRLLDVASGDGTSALLAAREFGCVVTGVDYGELAVAQAERSAHAAGLASCAHFVRGDAEALPQEDASFDLVLCECSLCLFPDRPGAVAEMRRVLRPGGRLALSDVVADHRRLPEQLGNAMARVACVAAASSQPQLCELLDSAGFEVLGVERRDREAVALAARIEDRLRGLRVLGLGTTAVDRYEVDEAIALTRLARTAIEDGALGYAIVAASGRSPLSPRGSSWP